MRGTGLSMIAAAAAVATSQALRFELSNVLGNNMVLQREPAEASVWGFSDPGQAVYATFKDQVSNDTWAIQSITDQAGQWTLPMPSRPADNHTYELVISSEPDPALYKWSGVVMLLTNIVYGDVLFFSGQSNMQVPVTFAFNSTEELALADTIGATGLVRVFQAAWTVASQNAAFSQLAQVQNPWALASSTSLPAFSATAWYTAKALFLERQGANANVPLGIVVSTWPGVPIKPWTTVATNEKCMPLYPLNETHADCGMFHWPCNTTALYNSMISPFMMGPMKVAGFVWYQGENDCTESEIFSGYYACQLAGLASDWRAGFQSPDAVWASVQLNAYFQAQNSHTLADFRAMQAATGDESIPSSYTARIFDLGDVTSPLGNIHSRNKQATGVRISAGIRALLYNESAVTSGPTYASATYGGVSTGSLTVTVSFQPGTVDGGFVYVPPHASPWSNSTRCPADIQRSADAYCAWFSIIASNGIAYNATVVEVTGGGADQLVLTAPGVPVGYTAVGSSFGWGDWPVVNHYAKASGLPLAPWYVNGTGAWQLPVPAPVRER